MPLAGGIVYGDKYPYILPVGLWVAGALLLIGRIFLAGGIMSFAGFMELSCSFLFLSWEGL